MACHEREYVLTFRLLPARASRTEGQVSCADCDWTARHTADTHDEVNQFLATLLLMHILDLHPTRIGTPEAT